MLKQKIEMHGLKTSDKYGISVKCDSIRPIYLERRY